MNQPVIPLDPSEESMRLGMVGLGRMGANLVRRLTGAGHRCVVFDRSESAVEALRAEGVEGVGSLSELVARLEPPRIVWMMLPASAVEVVVEELADLLSVSDVLVDGGNSYYRDDLRRSRRLGSRGIHLVDCGTSGGVWGLERGYCLMIGGETEVVRRLHPVFESIAPGDAGADPTPNRSRADGTAQRGFLHCGPSGAGHFVKMVHNGIEYGMMASIAEGLNILRHAGVGSAARADDAETAPLGDPDAYRYEFDLAEVAEVWRRGSVIGSWLVDLTADALAVGADLADLSGRVSDSGEGRWTVTAAIEEGVPVPVIAAALFDRFESRGAGVYADKILSAMRREFGGHAER
jgi:6-phosphogluconate dehydrogenase